MVPVSFSLRAEQWMFTQTGQWYKSRAAPDIFEILTCAICKQSKRKNRMRRRDFIGKGLVHPRTDNARIGLRIIRGHKAFQRFAVYLHSGQISEKSIHQPIIYKTKTINWLLCWAEEWFVRNGRVLFYIQGTDLCNALWVWNRRFHWPHSYRGKFTPKDCRTRWCYWKEIYIHECRCKLLYRLSPESIWKWVNTITSTCCFLFQRQESEVIGVFPVTTRE